MMDRNVGRIYWIFWPLLLQNWGNINYFSNSNTSTVCCTVLFCKVDLVLNKFRTFDVYLIPTKFRTFEDGFPNLFISNAHGIRGQHVAFLASFSSPGVIFEQLSVIYALPKLFVSSFTLVLPFFPTGTSERMEDEGDVATAFTLARILSNTPVPRGGPTSLVIFDIHALQVYTKFESSQKTWYFFLCW